MEQLRIALEKQKEFYNPADLALITRAYEFADAAHKGQLRKNGDPYISHTQHTALLLIKWRMPTVMVAAGLLHDVPEDTRHTIADVAREFGSEIASIVEGETKLSSLKYHGEERYAENLRKMFFAIAKDVRVVIVKFADRIDNLQTLHIFPEEKQKRIALESLEIYAPIANRLGMGAIRGELEDLSFPYLYPDDYLQVSELVQDRLKEKEDYLERIQKIIEGDLQKNGIHFVSVHGRTKHLYSLYKKLQEKQRDISNVYDIVAERIIVNSVQDCYAALGIIHQRWRPLKGRIKDYIAQPKPNGYQSLHTTIFAEDGEIIEIQIRTQAMHKEAEFGIAAHWSYTEHGKRSLSPGRQTQWLKELAEFQKNIEDRSKFLDALESMKLDFFRNRIFVFTPKGDVIDLPEGATPIDFAYAIHTEVGDKCTGVRINDAIAPLSTHLHSGDIIDVITDKNRKGPSPDWVEFAKTAHARTKIKESLRKAKLSGWIRNVFKK